MQLPSLHWNSPGLQRVTARGRDFSTHEQWNFLISLLCYSLNMFLTESTSKTNRSESETKGLQFKYQNSVTFGICNSVFFFSSRTDSVKAALKWELLCRKKDSSSQDMTDKIFTSVAKHDVLTVAGQFIRVIPTVISAITPELMANTSAIYAAPVAFLTNSISCRETAVHFNYVMIS